MSEIYVAHKTAQVQQGGESEDLAFNDIDLAMNWLEKRIQEQGAVTDYKVKDQTDSPTGADYYYKVIDGDSDCAGWIDVIEANFL